jgi:hypothetical protein
MIATRLGQAGFRAPAAHHLRGVAAAALLVLCAPAYAADVTLSDLTIQEGPSVVSIPSVVVTGTEASAEDIERLLRGQMDADTARAFLKDLEAESISIPTIAVTNDTEPGSVTMTGFEVSQLSQGTAASISLGGVEMKDLPGDGGQPINGSIGAVTLENVDAAALILALEKGDLDLEDPTWMPKVEKMTVGASRFTGPMEGGSADISLGGILIEQSDFIGQVATKASIAFNNLAIVFPPNSEPGMQLKAFGYDTLDLSLSSTGSWNKDAKTYAIEDLTVTMADGGVLALSANLGNVDEVFFSGDSQTRMMAMLGAGVSDAMVKFTNNGLVEKAFAFAGQMQGGMSGADMQAQAGAMATMMLPQVLGEGPAQAEIAAAVSKFLSAPKSITLTGKAKAGMLSAQDFAAMQTPADVFAKVDVTANAE